jgi:prepilin-type N-terminal cleavage/methylation domain-containing protein
MKRRLGFTLVELLVVIAIIAILASIVTPQVASYINRARATKAQAEVKNVELALTKMLTDAGRKNFLSFLTAASRQYINNDLCVASRIDFYNYMFYELLRNGNTASLAGSGFESAVSFDQDVKDELGTSYLELAKDPWGENLYHFYAGPWDGSTQDGLGAAKSDIPFRIYDLDTDIPGTPPKQGDNNFSANTDLNVYVWSLGDDFLNNQRVPDCDGGFDAYNTLDPEFKGGGDDINNWDSTGSWSRFYS